MCGLIQRVINVLGRRSPEVYKWIDDPSGRYICRDCHAIINDGLIWYNQKRCYECWYKLKDVK